MIDDEHRVRYFAEDADTAADVYEFVSEYEGWHPQDPRALLTSPDGNESIELPQQLADLLTSATYLMSHGHAVALDTATGTLSVDEVADLAMQRPEDVRTAIEAGIIAVVPDQPERISAQEALTYRNMVRSERRVTLDEVYELGHRPEEGDPPTRPRGYRT